MSPGGSAANSIETSHPELGNDSTSTDKHHTHLLQTSHGLLDDQQLRGHEIDVSRYRIQLCRHSTGNAQHGISTISTSWTLKN